MKSVMSKTAISSFSLQNSYFRFKFFFDQNLDFVLGIESGTDDVIMSVKKASSSVAPFVRFRANIDIGDIGDEFGDNDKGGVIRASSHLSIEGNSQLDG